MAKHDHPQRGDVVFGRFEGRRRMVDLDRRSNAEASPGLQGTGWLSDEEYARLSPAEKRKLYTMRKKARPYRRREAQRTRQAKAEFGGLSWQFAILPVLIVFALVWSMWPPSPPVPVSGEPPGSEAAWERARLAAQEERERAEANPHSVAEAAAAAEPAISETPAAVPSGPVRSFSFCHVGGGHNCVVDGDTIWMDGAKIRILDIDTPETHPPRCQREAELGDAATRRLGALLNSGVVTMEAGWGRDRDRYGRLLRRIYVDGVNVGDVLVSEGLARPYGGGRRSWC